ncbi:MAG TPA: hypothetical protein VG897_15785, partial [Terriglobales bacterium]|nr:hypothetical protein [Terriglobales bacterium]
KFDSSLQNDTYRNNTLGFTYKIPDGLEVKDSPLPNPDQTTTVLKGSKPSDERIKTKFLLELVS